jgi:hypothetical protein
MLRHLFPSLIVLTLVGLLVPTLHADQGAGDDARVSDFIKALKSDNAAVRKQVALALGDLGEKALPAVPALREALLDSDKEVQAAAAKALGQIVGATPPAPGKDTDDPKKEILKLKERLEAVRADLEAQAADARKAREDALEQAKKVQEARAREVQLLKEREEILQNARIRADADKVLLVKMQEELSARSAEMKLLVQKLKEADLKALDASALVDKVQAQLSAARVEVETLRKRSAGLEERVRELEALLARTDKMPPLPPPPGVRNPPKDSVEGMITRVDEGTGLVTVSVGSDAGLQKGHTLEVFRLNPPKYLGTIRIVDVRPTEAAGQFVVRPTDMVKPGDRVASKLVGN